MDFTKNKKSYTIIAVSIVAIILTVLGGYFLIFKKSTKTDNSSNLLKTENSKKLKIATALTSMKEFLENETFKAALKKEGIELDVNFTSNDFTISNNLLNENNVLAKLDSHLPYTYDLNKKNNKGHKAVVVQPFYWSYLSLYNTKNTRTNKNKINDWTNFETIKTENNTTQPIKILLCNDSVQIDYMLRFLENLKIITRKSEKTDDKLGEKFKLDKECFNIPENIEIIIPSNIDLSAALNSFKSSNEYDLFISYPSIAGEKSGELNNIKKFEKPTPDSINSVYTISLITKLENKDNELLKKFASVLRQEAIIKLWKENYSKYCSIIEPTDIAQLTTNINKYFE